MLNKFVLIGDSLTQYSFDVQTHGFGAMLSNYYVRKMDVINRGYSGYNTKLVSDILQDVLAEFPSIAVATLCLGANDAVLPGGEQHVPLNLYKSKMLKMSRQILEKTNRFIIVTPPFVDDQLIEDRKNSVTIGYRNASIEVAKELGIPFLDLWSWFTGRDINSDKDIKPEDSKYLIDGLHFSKAGNHKVYRGLVRTIHQNWPELETLEPKFKNWRDLIKPE